MEIGYNSALPCLLALESMQQGRLLGWDAAARKSQQANHWRCRLANADSRIA